jgi:hypothetical protein
MATSSVKSLSKKLASVSAQAKKLGINTAKADSMVAQTSRQGGKSYAGSAEEKAYTAAIPMNAMQTTGVANVPPPPTTPDYGAVAPPSTTATTADTIGQENQNLFQQYLAASDANFAEVTSGEKRMAKLERDNQLQQKQQAVNNATESLNQIVTKQQQDLISTRGNASANGVTEAVYGGIQNEINRNAALQALPVQAQLAAAQNNLEMAQTHIDKLFAIQSQDAQAKYQYKSKVIDSLYNFANAEQQRKLDKLNLDESRKFTEKQANVAFQRDLAKEAFANGQSSLGASLMSLKPDSPTYQQDLGRIASQIQQPKAAPKAPDLQNFGTADNPDWRQYNTTSGSWDEIEGVGGGTGGNLSKVQRAKVSDSVTANKELAANIQEYKNLLDDVGFEGTTWGGANLGQFDALRGRITTTLKKAETLGTLDAGVLQLVDQLIGQKPEKGGLTQNFLGFGSRRVSSSLGKQLELIQSKIKTDEERLGGAGGFTLTTSDLSELDALFGETANTTESGFDPSEYF